MKPIITVLLLLFITLSYGQETKPRMLIQNVNIIPMHINTVLENRDIVIEQGKIISIRKHNENDTLDYALGKIDGAGKYLIPSFADAHVHLPEEKNLHNFFLMNLVNGVTTLRSMRGKPWHLNIKKDAEYSPQLILSAPAISRRDSLSVDMARELVAGYKEAGFDFVKILSVKNKVTFNNLVSASKKHELPISGHCPANIGIFNVCKSGVFQSIEHLGGFFALPDLEMISRGIDYSIDANVYHCPTLDWYYTGQVLKDSLRQRAGVQQLPKAQIEAWEGKIKSYYDDSSEESRVKSRAEKKRQFGGRLRYLGYIYRQGGKLLLSPDASGLYGIPGYGIHTEMAHYVEAGISNYDILKSTCYNLAQMLGQEKDWGTIRVGSKTDMILLSANPLTDIANAKKLEGIVFKGKFHTKKQLQAELDKGK